MFNYACFFIGQLKKLFKRYKHRFFQDQYPKTHCINDSEEISTEQSFANQEIAKTDSNNKN